MAMGKRTFTDSLMRKNKFKLFALLYFPSAIWITGLALLGEDRLYDIIDFTGLTGLILTGIVPGLITTFIAIRLHFKFLYLLACCLFPLLSLSTSIILSIPSFLLSQQFQSYCIANYSNRITLADSTVVMVFANGTGNQDGFRMKEMNVLLGIQKNPSHTTVSLLSEWSREELSQFVESRFPQKKVSSPLVDKIWMDYKILKSVRTEREFKIKTNSGPNQNLFFYADGDFNLLINGALWHVQALSLLGAIFVICSFFSIELKFIRDQNEDQLNEYL